MGRHAVRRGVAVVTALAIAGTAGLAAIRRQNPTPPSPQRPIFRGGVDLVTIDAYPRRNGRLVEGLTAADFEVFEDGKPQAIEQFEFMRIEAAPDAVRTDPSTVGEAAALASDPRRRVFVIVLDVYHVRILDSTEVRGALLDFLHRRLGEQDLFGVTTPRQAARALTLGRRTVSIANELDRHRFWGERDSITIDPDDPVEKQLAACHAGRPQMADELIARRRADRTVRSLEDLIEHLGTMRDTRTAMIVVSEGWPPFEPASAPLASLGPPGISVRDGVLTVGAPKGEPVDPAACHTETARLLMLNLPPRTRMLATRAKRQNVVFYPMLPRARSRISVDVTPGVDDPLEFLAAATGGLTATGTIVFRESLARIAEDTSAYYLIGYRSTNAVADGSRRSIAVRVPRSDVDVAARSGYTARSATVVPTRGEPPAAARAALERLVIDTPDQPLRASAIEWRAGEELAVVVELAGERGSLRDADNADADMAVEITAVDANGETVGRATGRIGSGSRAAVIHVPLATPTSGWRVTTRVSAGQRVWTEALNLAAGSRSIVGDPIVFRAGAASASPLRPTVVAHFRRTERVHVEWPLREPIDRSEARLLDRRGHPLPIGVTLAQRATAHGPVLAADLRLSPLAAGDYLIDVIAGRGAESIQRFVALRIVP